VRIFKIAHLIFALLASNSLKGFGIIGAFLAVRLLREYKLPVRRIIALSSLAFRTPMMGKVSDGRDWRASGQTG
jgi:hypothetical protein